MTDQHDSDKGGPSGWTAWSNYVLKALETMHERAENLESRIRAIESELAVLKTKVALYVTVGAAIIAGVFELARFIAK